MCGPNMFIAWFVTPKEPSGRKAPSLASSLMLSRFASAVANSSALFSPVSSYHLENAMISQPENMLRTATGPIPGRLVTGVCRRIQLRPISAQSRHCLRPVYWYNRIKLLATSPPQPCSGLLQYAKYAIVPASTGSLSNSFPNKACSRAQAPTPRPLLSKPSQGSCLILGQGSARQLKLYLNVGLRSGANPQGSA